MGDALPLLPRRSTAVDLEQLEAWSEQAADDEPTRVSRRRSPIGAPKNWQMSILVEQVWHAMYRASDRVRAGTTTTPRGRARAIRTHRLCAIGHCGATVCCTK